MHYFLLNFNLEDCLVQLVFTGLGFTKNLNLRYIAAIGELLYLPLRTLRLLAMTLSSILQVYHANSETLLEVFL